MSTIVSDPKQGGLPSWLRGVLIYCTAMAMALLVQSAFGAPPAQSRDECINAAELALTARAHIEVGITRAQSEAILRLVFKVENPRGEALLASIMAAADRDKRSSQDFGLELGVHCLSTGGDLKGFLGVAL